MKVKSTVLFFTEKLKLKYATQIYRHLLCTNHRHKFCFIINWQINFLILERIYKEKQKLMISISMT